MSDTKTRSSATLEVPTKKVMGTNFFVQLIMLVGSLFSFFAFKEAEVGAVVASVFGILGFGGAIREGYKVYGAKANFMAWLSSPNTWSYLSAIVAYVLPSLSPDFAATAQKLTDALFAGNYQQVITAGFSLLSIIFFSIKKGK
jgi:hypothetical protein